MSLNCALIEPSARDQILLKKSQKLTAVAKGSFTHYVNPKKTRGGAQGIGQEINCHLLHFVAFFHVASLFSTGVDNKKVGVDNEKALELTNSTVFHRGRQQKSSRAGQQNNFFIF